MLVNKDAYQRETLTKWPVRLLLNVIKNIYFLFIFQVLQIDLRVIIKNNICTYRSPLAFRDFQMGLCKTVVRGT